MYIYLMRHLIYNDNTIISLYNIHLKYKWECREIKFYMY